MSIIEANLICYDKNDSFDEVIYIAGLPCKELKIELFEDYELRYPIGIAAKRSNVQILHNAILIKEFPFNMDCCLKLIKAVNKAKQYCLTNHPGRNPLQIETLCRQQ